MVFSWFLEHIYYVKNVIFYITMNDGRECRICMIGDEEEELIQPCRCTTAYVHESCLQKWRENAEESEKS